MSVGEIEFAENVLSLSSKREDIEEIIKDVETRRELDRHEKKFVKRAFSDFLVALKLLEERTGAREIAKENSLVPEKEET